MLEVFPNDLGDQEHRWSWLVEAKGGRRNLLWLHRCGDRWATCWIDLASGKRHRLVSEEPLTIKPSVLCPIGCGDHGYIRDGRWVTA
jgi:hypothetical protein